MKKVRKTLVPLLLMTSVFATSVFAAPTKQELEDKKNQAESQVESLQDELTGLMTELNLTERKLISKGEEIIAATEQLEVAKTNEEQQYNNMVKRIVAMYESGNTNMLGMLLESGTIAEMLQNVENVQTVHEYDRQELQKYIETKETIITLKATLESEQVELEKLQKSLETQKKSLSRKIEAKKAEVANFQEQIEEAERKAAEEARRRAEEERRRREEEEARNNQKDKDKNQIIINSNSNTSSGKYTGTGDPSVGQAIVAAARTYIGVDYVWGGNGYNGIDCSGLTKAAHAAVGISILRWSGDQKANGKKINSVAEALPGDIIGYEGHVAIYIGNGRVIHAPCTGKKVQEASVYMKTITAIRRYW